MKREETKNLINRLISICLLILVIVFIVLATIKVFSLHVEGIVLDTIALIGTGLFCLFEIIVISLGKKKESHLKNIAYEESGRINVFPLVMVSIGTVFGIVICAIGTYLYFSRPENDAKANVLIIVSIGGYLLVNCIIYYIYLVMFRKKDFKLEDLIK